MRAAAVEDSAGRDASPTGQPKYFWKLAVRRRDRLPEIRDAVGDASSDRLHGVSEKKSPLRPLFPASRPGFHPSSSERRHPCVLKVAVVIPLHNHARYIGAALESLRVQTRPPDRVIIIDDGSTDGSLNAVVAYSEPPRRAPGPRRRGRPRVQTRTDVLLQAHRARRPRSTAPSPWPTTAISWRFSMPDDSYHPRRIERCLEYLEAHPQLDLVCTRLRLMDEAGRTLPSDARARGGFRPRGASGRVCDDQNALDLPEWLGLANFPGTTSNFFARAAYLRAHPLLGYRHTHDYYALVLAALENRLGVLDAELLDYRVHAPTTRTRRPPTRSSAKPCASTSISRACSPRASPPSRSCAGRSPVTSARPGATSAPFAPTCSTSCWSKPSPCCPPRPPTRCWPNSTHTRFPEVGQFPNRAIINTHDSAAPALGPTSGLADKFYGLKAQLSAVRSGARPWAEYRQIQAVLLESRWFALGRVLGLTRPVNRAGGKNAPEKLALLRERSLASRWLRLGNRLGSSSARRLLAMGAAVSSDVHG